MRIPKIDLIWNRRKTASHDDTASVEYQITLNGKRKYISANIQLLLGQWKNGKVVKHPKMLEYNNILSSNLIKMWDVIREKGDKTTWNDISSIVNPTEYDEQKTSFVEYMADRIATRTDIREGTLAHHHVVLNKLSEYGKIRYWSDLTTYKIRAFDEYIRKSGICQSSIWGYHKTIRAYVKEGIANGFLDKSPYDNFKVDKGKCSKIRYLTEEELLRIKNTPMDGRFENVRKMFVLQCYTGQAFSDFVSTDFYKLKDSGNTIIDQRTKTGVPYRVKLMAPAREILDDFGWNLPRISMQKYNEYLKVVGKLAGVGTELTSHVARHTFAVMMINNGVSMDIVAKMLGHSSTKNTQIYAEILGKTVDDAFDELETRLK